MFQTCSIAHVIISSSSSDSLQRFECSLHKANEASGVSLKRNRVSVEEIYMCGKMNVRSNEMTLSISTFQNSDLFPIIHWPPWPSVIAEEENMAKWLAVIMMIAPISGFTWTVLN